MFGEEQLTSKADVGATYWTTTSVFLDCSLTQLYLIGGPIEIPIGISEGMYFEVLAVRDVSFLGFLTHSALPLGGGGVRNSYWYC